MRRNSIAQGSKQVNIATNLEEKIDEYLKSTTITDAGKTSGTGEDVPNPSSVARAGVDGSNVRNIEEIPGPAQQVHDIHRDDPGERHCERSSPACERSSVDCDAECIPGKLVSFISGQVRLMKVEILINNIPVIAMLDSGAEKSFISSDLARDLKLDISKSESVFNAIGEKTFKTIGTVKTPLMIHGVEMCNINLIVFPTVPNNFIQFVLGIDFLRENKIELCVSRRMIAKHLDGGGRIEIYIDRCGTPLHVMLCSLPCYASSAVRLEAGRVQQVPVYYRTPAVAPDHLLMYSDESGKDNLDANVHGLAGFFNVQTKSILMASRELNIDVRKGQYVGTLDSVYQLPHEESVSQSNELTNDNFKNRIALPELSIKQQTEVFNVLSKYKTVFSTGDNDVGLASVTSHTIKLTDETPIYQRPRRFPQPITEEIERQCQELNSLDIIEPSASPWSSPVVPVRKSDGSIRM